MIVQFQNFWLKDFSNVITKKNQPIILIQVQGDFYVRVVFKCKVNLYRVI